MMTRFLFAVLLIFSAAAPASAQEMLRLNTGTRTPYTTPERQGFLDLLVAEIFDRLGVKAEVSVYQASARALLSADQGLDDGAAMRIKGLEKKYPNLVMVPEVVINNDFVALSAAPEVKVESFADLAPYEVAYIIGWQVYKKNVGNVAHLRTVKDPEQLFLLLKNDRTQVILHERWQGLWRAKEMGLNAKVQEPPLASVPMYMYLNKVHAHLVEPAAKALRAMKADGTYQAIVDKTLTPLVRP